MPEQEPTGALPEVPAAPSSPADTPPDANDGNVDFEAFYRSTIKQLVAFLIVQGARLHDAAEIAQDTLCLAYQRWDTINNHRAWSFRVASRELIRRVATVEEPTAEPSDTSPLLRHTNIANWELQHDLVHAILQLPPRQRQVMAWTFFAYTPTEIAEEIGMTADAVRASLLKARRRLATRLPAREDDE